MTNSAKSALRRPLRCCFSWMLGGADGLCRWNQGSEAIRKGKEQGSESESESENISEATRANLFACGFAPKDPQLGERWCKRCLKWASASVGKQATLGAGPGSLKTASAAPKAANPPETSSLQMAQAPSAQTLSAQNSNASSAAGTTALHVLYAQSQASARWARAKWHETGTLEYIKRLKGWQRRTNSGLVESMGAYSMGATQPTHELATGDGS